MEWFDVVDENGIPTGKTVERSIAHRDGIAHRTAHIWIIRKGSEGETEILLQQRSENKDSFPLQYDTSSAGHIRAGDEPLPSAVREMGEELGINVREEDLTFAGTFLNKYEQVFHGELFRDNEISFVYIYEKPVDIRKLVLQEEEVKEVRWFSLSYVIEETRKHNEMFCVPTGSLKLLEGYLSKREETKTREVGQND
ncbi:MAG: NUDIX domain-containing protein [Clostridia bacterium]|nr:NUDIX domain-containing protein [Clostridia bacterium]